MVVLILSVGDVELEIPVLGGCGDIRDIPKIVQVMMKSWYGYCTVYTLECGVIWWSFQVVSQMSSLCTSQGRDASCGKTRRLVGEPIELAQKFSFWLSVPRNHPCNRCMSIECAPLIALKSKDVGELWKMFGFGCPSVADEQLDNNLFPLTCVCIPDTSSDSYCSCDFIIEMVYFCSSLYFITCKPLYSCEIWHLAVMQWGNFWLRSPSAT